MSGFVQIIEYTTTRIDEIRALGQEMESRLASRDGGPVRVTVTADRDRANVYRTIAEFASYDEAMANSNDAATSEFAEKMSKLVDGPPTFYNLDVLETFTPRG